jgi:hypothetical protein
MNLKLKLGHYVNEKNENEEFNRNMFAQPNNDQNSLLSFVIISKDAKVLERRQIDAYSPVKDQKRKFDMKIVIKRYKMNFEQKKKGYYSKKYLLSICDLLNKNSKNYLQKRQELIQKYQPLYSDAFLKKIKSENSMNIHNIGSLSNDKLSIKCNRPTRESHFSEDFKDRKKSYLSRNKNSNNDIEEHKHYMTTDANYPTCIYNINKKKIFKDKDIYVPNEEFDFGIHREKYKKQLVKDYNFFNLEPHFKTLPNYKRPDETKKVFNNADTKYRRCINPSKKEFFRLLELRKKKNENYRHPLKLK